MSLPSRKAALVPLGIQLKEWTNSMEPKSTKTRSEPGKSYTMVEDPSSGSTDTYYTVTTAPREKNSNRKEVLDYSSPIRLAVDRAKERERMSESLSHNEVSLDSASVSTGLNRNKPTTQRSAAKSLISRVKKSGAQKASRKRTSNIVKDASKTKGAKKK